MSAQIADTLITSPEPTPPASTTQQIKAATRNDKTESCSHPKLSGEAVYGLSGKIVKKLLPETEAHPAALLIEFLTDFGNVIGRTAYYEVESTEHRGNIFAVKVGKTSKARKGTARARIEAIFKDIDPPWFDRHFTGLSSGEGIIWNVRDASGSDEGISDKRMFIRADEFAGTLAVMGRDGNTLSPVIRSAWDGVPLQITTKNNPAKSTGHHISTVGDITQEELQSSLRQADKFNGFANRFLWVFTERTKKLPFGGRDLNLTKEKDSLKEAVQFARKQGRVFMTPNARKVWKRAYDKLSEAHPGLFGAVTSRSEAQVIRLALLFALLDCSKKIGTKHLQAALALWQYCEDSARYIFHGLSLQQLKILDTLSDGRPRTKTQIRGVTFSGHRDAEVLTADLDALEKAGRIRRMLVGGTEQFAIRAQNGSAQNASAF